MVKMAIPEGTELTDKHLTSREIQFSMREVTINIYMA